MIRAALIAIALVACSGKRKPPPPRPELIQTVRELADRVCACETDKECVRPLRDEWDAEKDDVMRHGLTGEQQGQFDAEVLRMRGCGDGAGLTFWMPPPSQD